ncbi:hypothetical protein J3Q64DRAFT_1705886 [Phycomyces blakesleeanus]|uniref:GIY-YIG domain-containing protein n=2 Tax=Phycomyces blakesleeanus TaxID=4837 RepID=A0A167PH33_PHYB8|nr:hypothetical protein PHYBLDRAFT_68596 [Phycomyces blakesleeanus NRRL 1555(-)]OAD77899.1 hypothetical protein PHYBLDRAFT_68596 [Phycomyces blakesleeanus NRRL 1555(-)]|eukprot:XP_018295939.1 hypothetical protein PHYBLDRAFT_68596 [Phycomyces blakesleeanus NRRL 1555(-)]
MEPSCVFYSCYLIRSLNPDYPNRVYVGSTPDPIKRLRQHNGEITQGAKKTTPYRPWEMVMLVYGFPSNLCALAFENAWQHPLESRHLKRSKCYANKDNAFGMSSKQHANLLLSKMRAVHDVLSTKPFSRWPLNIHFITPAFKCLFEAEGQGMAGILLPHHIKTTLGPLTNLPLKKFQLDKKDDPVYHNFCSMADKVPCYMCKLDVEKKNTQAFVGCLDCKMVTHLRCLASHLLLMDSDSDNELVPVKGKCPKCDTDMLWGDLIQALKKRSTWALEEQ